MNDERESREFDSEELDVSGKPLLPNPNPGSVERRNFSTRSLPTITSSRAARVATVESVRFDANNNYDLWGNASGIG